MPKSSVAANVIDLEAYRRQRKMRSERQSEPTMPTMMAAPPMVVPYFLCWVPVWTPVLG